MHWSLKALIVMLVVQMPSPSYAQGTIGRAKDAYSFYRTYVQMPGKVVELFAQIESGVPNFGGERNYEQLSNSYLEKNLGVKGAELAENFLVGPVVEAGRSSRYFVQLSGLTKKECSNLASHPANYLFSKTTINGNDAGESACGGSLIRDWFFSGTNVIRFISR